jgi:predicted ribosomally synthesized peptide with nif11-like leader
MSVENATQFLQKLQKDPTLRTKLRAAVSGTRDEKAAQLVTFAARAGLDFTVADYEQALKAKLGQQHAAEELTEEQLDAVAGGIRGQQYATVTEGWCCP